MPLFAVPKRLTLFPGHHLQFRDADRGVTTWDLTGDDPQFLLRWPGGPLPPGLYALSLHLPAGMGALTGPVLYIDSGAGFNADEVVPLNFVLRGERAKAFFELPKTVRAIRFDPSSRSGSLQLGGAQLKRSSTTLWRLTRLAARVRGRVRGPQDVAHLTRRALAVLKGHGPAGLRSLLAEKLGDAAPQFSGPAGLSRNDAGQYELLAGATPYVYVPPERPVDFERVLEGMADRPTFSIVVPAYNTPLPLLEALLRSVHAQWYSDWELIICDDASPSPEVKRALAAAASSKVKVIFSDQNRGISGATNQAIKVAQGDYIVLLDHDDELTPDCLYELAKRIALDSPDYIYSDEDKLDPQGRFCDPHFKPDWSPHTMMSTMYVCHVSCIRRSLIDELGGLRSEYDGCQDWDLILRLTEKTKRIAHIPKVLYHWRIIPGSVAGGLTEKPYVLDASRRAREDALRRRGLFGTIEPVPELPGHFRAHYEAPRQDLVSVIIPSRDNGPILEACINSIRESADAERVEIVVLDNGSVVSETLDYLETLGASGAAQVIRHDAPFNFSELNNIGVRATRGRFLLFLNDDITVITEDFASRMAGFAALPDAGAVGAKLLYPGSGTIQHAAIVNLEDGPGHAFLGRPADAPGYFGRAVLDYNWLAVTGACLMVERTKFDAVGGFDEAFPIAYNDVDLCFRLYKAGYHNAVCQAARLYHHESVSRGIDHLDSKRALRLAAERRALYLKHPDLFQYDPYFNVNLHPNGTMFQIGA